MIGLTIRESQCLATLIDWSSEHGVMPTRREICGEIGLGSPGGVNRLVGALEAKGYVRRLKYGHRAIEILDPNAGPCPHCAHPVGSAACRAAASNNITYSTSPVLKAGVVPLGGPKLPSPLATEGAKSQDWMG